MKFKPKCYKCFNALSTGARIEIINLLQINKRMNVTDIVRHFKLSQPTITHHLRYLTKSGILNFQKEGRKVYYCIKPFCSKNDCKLFSLN